MKSKTFEISPARDHHHSSSANPRSSGRRSISVNLGNPRLSSNPRDNPSMMIPEMKLGDDVPIGSSKKLKRIKYLLLIYLFLVLIFEIFWTYFIVKYQLISDLRSYHENWDEVWIKEFYKSTKNFFLFILILLILAIAIGIASVTTSNKHLAQTFIAVLLIEWIFEFIGVYESRDRNVLIYRLVPCTLRPGLLTLTFMFIKKLNQEDQECEDMNKDDESRIPNTVQSTHIQQQSYNSVLQSSNTPQDTSYNTIQQSSNSIQQSSNSVQQSSNSIQQSSNTSSSNNCNNNVNNISSSVTNF